MSAHSTRTPRTVIAVLALLAAGALSGCSLIADLTNETARDEDGQVVGSNDDADAFSILVGDCLNDAGLSGEITTVPLVNCAEPHDSEAYYSHQVEAAELPADDDLFAEADEVCLAAFEDFVGIPYDESTLNFTYYYPTESSWANGDREVLCLIFDPAGQVTGTLESAGR